MKKIEAFVGHSFEPSDKDIVRFFLDYLDTIRDDTGINFSWDHAEKAKPKEISKKVKEKIIGKNLFIGICTKKELVIKEHLLKEGLINKKKVSSDRDNFEWKTSDWVLQELGYCLGQNMSTIILLEEGVREISGLQADLEYIVFNRENPTLSFQRILQQISSLDYKSASYGNKSDNKSISKEDTEEKSKDSNDSHWKVPNNSWDKSRYYVALYLALEDEDTEAEVLIYNSRKDKLKQNNEEAIDWEADYLVLKQRTKNESAIAPIEKLIKKNPTILSLHLRLAEVYTLFESFDLAFNEAEKLLQNDETSNFTTLQKTVSYLKKSKGSRLAREYLRSNLDLIKADDRTEFLKFYAELHKDDLPNLYISLSEAYLALIPDDSSFRFDLAYQYSELNQYKLSAFHYKKLTQSSPSSSNWNNLGVSYENLGLHTKSIESYQNSEELNGTLAMSNIASKLIKAGFVQEANKTCKHAMSFDNFDERNISTLKNIHDKVETDNTADENIEGDTKETRDFLVSYANALSNSNTDFHNGKYKHPDCNLDISTNSNEFKANGSFQKNQSATLGLAAAYMHDKPLEKINYKINIQGEFQGNAVVAKINITSDTAKSLLGSLGDEKDILMYFSLKEKCFFVAELSTDNLIGNFYKLEFVS